MLFAQIYDIMGSYGYKKYPKIYSFWEGESYEDKEKQQKMAADVTTEHADGSIVWYECAGSGKCS